MDNSVTMRILHWLAVFGTLCTTDNRRCASFQANTCYHVIPLDMWVYKSACYKYELCNACGVQYGIKRQECDEKYNAMWKAICTLEPAHPLLPCAKVRDIFHKALTLAVNYTRNPQPFCFEDWVLPCFN